MSEKIFVFDLDNTLVKTNRANNESYKEAILAVTGKSVEINRRRFTRADLLNVLPNLSDSQIAEIVKEKEKCYEKHISETTLNKQLLKILNMLKSDGYNTVLLTESRKIRAQRVCNYYSLTPLFVNQYFKDDYINNDKYLFLKQLPYLLQNVVLFENEQAEIYRAMQNGISENQIIKFKF